MDEFLLWANNVSSITLMLAAWWLAHAYAAAGFPHGRAIGGLWAAIGLSVMVTAFARNLYIDPDPFIIITKWLMVGVAVLSARRIAIRARQIDHLRSRETAH